MIRQTTGRLRTNDLRKTNAQPGRHVSVTPQNSTMRHLAYGRIVLKFFNACGLFLRGRPGAALICLSGVAFNKKQAGVNSNWAVRRHLHSTRFRD